MLTFFGVCGFILLVLLLGIVGGGVILFDFETSLGRAACFTAIFFLSVWAFGRAWARESKIPPGDSLPLWGKTLLLLSAPGCFVWGAGIYAAGHVPLANACYNAVIANDMKQLRQCVALRAAIRRHPDYKGDYSVRAFMPDTYAAFHEIVAEDRELTPCVWKCCFFCCRNLPLPFMGGMCTVFSACHRRPCANVSLPPSLNRIQ